MGFFTIACTHFAEEVMCSAGVLKLYLLIRQVRQSQQTEWFTLLLIYSYRSLTNEASFVNHLKSLSTAQ